MAPRPLLPVEDAKARILAGVRRLGSETVTLDDALGRVLAKDLKSRRDQPPFAASAMDGYAVRAGDVGNCPIDLSVIGEAPAGHGFAGKVAKGQAVRIFTGAPLPTGADAIVIQENTTAIGDNVTVHQRVQSGEFVRPKGLDFKSGETLLEATQVLGARDIGLAASMGFSELPVVRKPVVGLIATGDELVEPGSKARSDQIVSSNSHALAAFVRHFGGKAIDAGIIRDDLTAITHAIGSMSEADVVITIGGASVGDHDLVQAALKQAGYKLDFWRIAMRPGKPLMFGRKGKQRIIGLPGNPVSAQVCSRIFVKPLMDALLGLQCEDQLVEARTTVALGKNDQRQDYLRARLHTDESGKLWATPFSRQDSSMQRVFSAADGLIIRSPHASPVRKGARIGVLRLDF